MNITTDKEAFEHVSKMLIEQNTRSMDDASNCKYRGFKEETIDKTLEEATDIARNSGEHYWNEDIDTLHNELLQQIGYDAKCAVGHLVADEWYNPDFEGDGIDGNNLLIQAIRNSNPNWAAINICTLDMLMTLQNIHDTEDPSDWKKIFGELLNNFTKEGEWIIND